jgi:hypothetical protein
MPQRILLGRYLGLETNILVSPERKQPDGPTQSPLIDRKRGRVRKDPQYDRREYQHAQKPSDSRRDDFLRGGYWIGTSPAIAIDLFLGFNTGER